MHISEWLTQTAHHFFVGREKEMEQLRSWLFDPQWNLVHIHGYGGIGKTALIRVFSQRFFPSNTIYLSQEFQEREEFLSAVSGKLKEKEQGQHGVLLVLDSIERMKPIERWLREEWIPMLSTKIRVVTIDRQPLDREWVQEFGWGHLIRFMKVEPFSRVAISHYMSLQGIKEVTSQEAIERFSGGVPLALQEACKYWRNRGEGEALQQDQLIQSLLRSIISEQAFRDPWMLYTAALFWRFNEEWLKEVMEEHYDHSIFKQLCKFPFVTLAEEGWTIVPPLRRWILRDLIVRFPSKYVEFKKRALTVIQTSVASVPQHLQGHAVVEMIQLSGDEPVQEMCFIDRYLDLEERQVKETDLHLFKSDPIIATLWEVEPATVKVFWAQSQMMAYVVFVEFNEKIRRTLVGDPLLTDYIKTAPLREEEYLVYISEPHEPQTAGSILRYVFRQMVRRKIITVVTSVPSLAPIFRSLGFQDLIAYQHIFQIDLRERDWFEVFMERNHMRSPRPIDGQSFTILIKKLLTKYHFLEHELKLLQSFKDSTKQSHEVTELPLFLRQKIDQALQSMASSHKEDRLYSDLLTKTYLQKNDSHEGIAEELNISLSTYYRTTKKAIERLSAVMMSR
ncbi:ATP-binding protein [Ammoniphilus sp. CFH 90114]|uniref:ATP-binding protein n=1 Tax=Ammoniphilus sp. CFH 90114 TaxID=2493665 RepID=UPI00100E2B79|nr:ATP-binding protein [Ammoniphilus sp. CFH 90114]RXT03992.1 ATP-binding protein [Ammoniphilus sp. CFH 90114]